MEGDDGSALRLAQERRRRFMIAAAGTTLAVLGGVYVLRENDATRRARQQKLPDGRPRLPPGQKVIDRLKPMGGSPGDPAKSNFRLRVHGEVDNPMLLDFGELREQFEQRTMALDVHCVTGWSRLDAEWTGVKIADIAAAAGVKPEARHVIIEGARGYTANIRLDEAVADDSLIAYRLDGRSLEERHGAPVRAVIPQLYFWKSTKWITGLRFETRDIPGYWEIRGYHNHADPWKEERYG